MSGCAAFDAMLSTAHGLCPTPAASCMAGHDLGYCQALTLKLFLYADALADSSALRARPQAQVWLRLIAFHIPSHTFLISAGALADSSALRGHPQAQAFLGQLRQPFDTLLASSASKVQNSASSRGYRDMYTNLQAHLMHLCTGNQASCGHGLGQRICVCVKGSACHAG